MSIPNHARYDYCCEMANEFLINENITSLPFDADRIIKKHKWARLKYSELAFQYNTTVDDISEAYGSKDAFTIFNGNNYAIAYNNTVKVKQRIYFTKLHEIGHIYLGHFTEFNETILSRYNITKQQYKILENEANCFARNILVPAGVIFRFNDLNPNIISNIFEVTTSAAKTRLDFLNSDLHYLSSENIEKQLNHFYNFIYKRKCLKCGHGLISEDAKYCPICGHYRLVWGDGFMKYYDGILLDDDGHATICPRCENEDIGEHDIYCKICGAYLLQHCADVTETDSYGNEYIERKGCGCKLDSNARYCPQCGSISTFNKFGYLVKWNEEKENIEEMQRLEAETEAAADNDIDDIPF